MATPTSATDADALLLQDLAWVRNLARRLLADPSSADDVVHDAWLAARRRAQPPRAGWRAWLAAVVHNRVRRLARTEARRERRERAAAAVVPAAAPSTLDVVERGALYRELTAAVMALAEPFRSAVLLRYLDELPGDRIAARLGISPEAARKRVSRGLQLLRERLDRGRRGGIAAWTAAWTGHASWPIGTRSATDGASAADAASGGDGARVTAGTAAASPPVAIVPATWLAATIAAAAVGIGWIASTNVAQSSARAVTAVAPPMAAPGPDGASGPVRPPDPLREPVPPPPRWSVVGGDGVPARGVTVLALAHGELRQHATTDGDGAVRLPFPASVDEVLIAARGVVPSRLPWRHDAAASPAVLGGGGSVAGRVALPSGSAATLRLEHDGAPAWPLGLAAPVLDALAALGIAVDHVAVDVHGDGAFRFDGLAPGWRGALALGAGWTLRDVHGRTPRGGGGRVLLRDARTDLELEAVAPVLVRGRLLRAGEPVSGETVFVLRNVHSPDGGLAVTDGAGRFAVAIAPPDPGDTAHALLVAGAGDGALQRSVALTAADREVEVGDVELGRAVTLTVADEHGAPIDGAEVIAACARGGSTTARAGADGIARVEAVPPTAASLIVRARGYRSRSVPVPAAGAATVALARGNGFTIVVRDAHGAPLGGVALDVEADVLPFELPGADAAAAARPFLQQFSVDAQGRFDAADLVPGVLVRLRALDVLGAPLAQREVVAPPLGRVDEVELAAAGPVHWLRGTVHTDAGTPVARATVHVGARGASATGTSDAGGAFRIGPMRAAADRCSLEVRHDAFVTAVRSGVELGANAPAVDVVLARGRSLRVRVAQADGQPVRASHLRLVADDANVGAAFAAEREPGVYVFASASAGPGTVELELAGSRFAQRVDGEAAQLDVHVPTMATLVVTPPAPPPPAHERAARSRVVARITPCDPAATPFERPFAATAAGTAPLELTLPPGRYEVELRLRTIGRAVPRVLAGARRVQLEAGVRTEVPCR